MKFNEDSRVKIPSMRLMEKGDLTNSESQLFEALSELKEAADNQIFFWLDTVLSASAESFKQLQ